MVHWTTLNWEEIPNSYRVDRASDGGDPVQGNLVTFKEENKAIPGGGPGKMKQAQFFGKRVSDTMGWVPASLPGNAKEEEKRGNLFGAVPRSPLKPVFFFLGG